MPGIPQQLHEVMDPLVCKECGKLFYSESSYRRHMRQGRAQFKCKVCYIQFNAVKNMWDHMWEVRRTAVTRISRQAAGAI